MLRFKRKKTEAEPAVACLVTRKHCSENAYIVDADDWYVVETGDGHITLRGRKGSATVEVPLGTRSMLSLFDQLSKATPRVKEKLVAEARRRLAQYELEASAARAKLESLMDE